MAILIPSIEHILNMKAPPTEGELHRQRCHTNRTILKSLHDNVAILLYDADIVHIFAARIYKLNTNNYEN